MLALAEYLDPRLVLFIDEESRDEALLKLVEALYDVGKIEDKEIFYQAILEREKVVSTGIGMGVAIPHAKQASYHDFFIAVGIQREKGIPWEALDSAPVHLIFLVGGPDDKQTQYLQILSLITVAVKEESRRKALLQAEDPKAVVKLFSYS